MKVYASLTARLHSFAIGINLLSAYRFRGFANRRHHIYYHHGERVRPLHCASAHKSQDGAVNSLRGEVVPKFPLIKHLHSEVQYLNLEAFACSDSEISPEKYQELVGLGAVYFRRGNISTSTPNKLTNSTQRVTHESSSQDVPVESYCRVHMNPKRFPLVETVRWQNQILSIECIETIEGPITVVVVDKISGVPIGPTLDNKIENVQHQVESVLPLSIPPDLHASSRLDVCTSGIVSFAAGVDSARRLHRLTADRATKKRYRLLCTKSVPLGQLRHCFRRNTQKSSMKPRLLAPFDPALIPTENKTEVRVPANPHGTLVSTPQSADTHKPLPKPRARGNRRDVLKSEWQLAELVVLSCQSVKVDHLSTELFDMIPELSSNGSAGNVKWSVLSSGKCAPAHLTHNEDVRRSPPPNILVSDQLRLNDDEERHMQFFEVEVELVTGRTHQIRLQMAAVGAAIVGDTRYAPVSGRLAVDGPQYTGSLDTTRAPHAPSLVRGSHTVAEVGDQGDGHVDDACEEEKMFGPDPAKICLQSSQLIFPEEVLKWPRGVECGPKVFSAARPWWRTL